MELKLKPTDSVSGNRKLVAEAEKVMFANGGRICDLPVEHYFSQGVYAREIFIPKGTVLTGHIHNYTQLNIMSKGDLSVLTEKGVMRVQAPFTIVSPPGTKRIAYAHEDTIWTTIHGTDETDLEKIEAHYISHSEEEYVSFLEKKSICSRVVHFIENKIRSLICLGAQ